MLKKSVEILTGIERWDRKIARKLILEDKLKFSSMHHYQSLNVFLKVAVESRDAVLLRKLLELKPNLDTLFGARILWIVADDGDTEIASMLVRAGAYLNINKPYRPNLLNVLAASKNPKKLDLAILMMEHGAKVMAKDANGCTALTYAISNENFNFARELLKRNAVIERVDFYQAVIGSKTDEWIMLFIEDYPNNEITRSGRIAQIFSWFCEINYDEEKIANWLNILFDVEVPHESIIHSAVCYERFGLVKSILNSNRIDKDTKMTLLYPAMILKKPQMAKMLIEWGINVNYRLEIDVYPFPSKILPIVAACACQSVEIIKLLLRLGADLNDAPYPEMTALHASLRFNSNLNEANKLVIKHLALLMMEGTRLNDKDLELIHGYPCILEFYDQCLRELEDMKKLEISNKFTLYSIFNADIKDLSILARRRQFRRNCNPNFINLLFPLYSEELNRRIVEAKTRRHLLSSTEIVMYETLGGILPDLVIDKIMLYLYDSEIHLKIS